MMGFIMKVWRVSITHNGGFDEGGSGGFRFFANRKEAQRFADESEGKDCELERFDVSTAKARLIAWLNIYASHPDNG